MSCGIAEERAWRHFEEWAGEDAYFPLAEELAALADAGFSAEAPWRGRALDGHGGASRQPTRRGDRSGVSIGPDELHRGAASPGRSSSCEASGRPCPDWRRSSRPNAMARATLAATIGLLHRQIAPARPAVRQCARPDDEVADFAITAGTTDTPDSPSPPGTRTPPRRGTTGSRRARPPAPADRSAPGHRRRRGCGSGTC